MPSYFYYSLVLLFSFLTILVIFSLSSNITSLVVSHIFLSFFLILLIVLLFKTVLSLFPPSPSCMLSAGTSFSLMLCLHIPLQSHIISPSIPCRFSIYNTFACLVIFYISYVLSIHLFTTHTADPLLPSPLCSPHPISFIHLHGTKSDGGEGGEENDGGEDSGDMQWL